MSSMDRIQKMRDKLEDDFINLAEAGIRQGQTFEDAILKKNPAYGAGGYGEYERRYNQWKGYAVRPEYFSLESERQAVQARRKKEAEAACTEAFYQSNKTMLTGLAEQRQSFEQTHLPEELRPHYQRAFAEVWGRHAKLPEGDPAQVGFLAGFMSE